MNESRIKSELVAVSRKLWARGFVANHDGNVSVRVAADRIWATPTAVSKGDVTEEMLVLLDLNGQRVAGRLKPFSEINLHLACYRARPEVRAVVHAHPPTATGFAVAGVPLPEAMMPEAIVSLGATIPTVDYAPPGPKAAEAVDAAVRRHDAFLLAAHGVLTVGSDLEQAYLRAELVEHYARIAQVARALGGARPLPADDVKRLLEARAKAGLGPQGAPAASPAPAKAAPSPAAASAAAQDAVLRRAEAAVARGADQELARIVAEEISRALRGRP